MDTQKLHIVMYPWFALGHITAFLNLSNKLAERGHRISFLLPQKTQSKFNYLNLYPHLISFIPITVPSVEGLPAGAETTNDSPSLPLILTAMDLTQPTIHAHLLQLQPHIVFHDFTHWLPSLARKLGIKVVYYCTVNSATNAYLTRPGDRLIAEDLLSPPPNFPPSSIKLPLHPAGRSAFVSALDCHGYTFMKRSMSALLESDAICFKSCREMEGPFLQYYGKLLNRPVLLAGPAVPENPTSVLEQQFQIFLDGFQEEKVIYCSLGSECILSKEQFQELLLGLEQTGLPFLAALKITSESAMPEGFEERIKGKGLVFGGWVQQQLILKHPSVGCFVTHCGSGSLSEAMVNKCQLVLLPHVGDQYINAKFLSGDLKVGVEIEKGEEDGLFTREGVCKAIKAVTDDESEIGKEVRANHTKWREFLLSDGLENSYIDDLIKQLQSLVA